MSNRGALLVSAGLHPSVYKGFGICHLAGFCPFLGQTAKKL